MNKLDERSKAIRELAEAIIRVENQIKVYEEQLAKLAEDNTPWSVRLDKCGWSSSITLTPNVAKGAREAIETLLRQRIRELHVEREGLLE